MKNRLNADALESVKKSYFNILALFLSGGVTESRFVKCLLKWGFQLGLNPEDLTKSGKNFGEAPFTKPQDKVDTMEAIYHLVYMIQLDQVVEDVELEIATIYSQKLGFPQGTVTELFKSITTEAYDGAAEGDVRKKVIDFLKVNGL